MLHIHTLAQAKKTARSLEKALAGTGIDLPHGKALDLLAAMTGFQDWNAYAAANSEDVLATKLHDFELSHMEHSGDENYGPEVALVAHTGFQLRYSRDDEMCEYVRVCDPLGRELMYWHSDEWQEDPQGVMGAILGALVRAKPIEVRGKKEGTERIARKLPNIRDVDFLKAHAVVTNGRCYSVEWRDEKLLQKLRSASGSGLQDLEGEDEESALMLSYHDDGILMTTDISLAQLKELTWDECLRCFKNPGGQAMEFHYSVGFADHFGV